MIPPGLSTSAAAAPTRAAAPAGEPAAGDGAGPRFAALLAMVGGGDASETADEAAPETPQTETPQTETPQAQPPQAQVPQGLALPRPAPPILGIGPPRATPGVAPDQEAQGPGAAAAPATAAKSAGRAAAEPIVAPAPPPAPEAQAEPGAKPPDPAEGAAQLRTAAPAAPRAGGLEGPAPAAPVPVPDPAAAGAAWRLAQATSHGAEAIHAPKVSARPRDVAEQITLAVANAAEPRVELRLDPPELGRVQIRLTPTEAGLQAVVLADRPETQDFLRRNAEILRLELTEAGYGAVSLEFSAGQDAAPRDQGEGTRRAFAFGESGPVAQAAAPRPAAGPGGLDIRL